MRNILALFVIVFLSVNSFAQIDKEHLNVGEEAPEITGVDQFGKEINSKEIIEKNKILLIFYRGNWCPYCRKHLKKLQENLEELTKKGYYVLVVSPEKPEKTEETTKKINASFSIIHDANNKIMEAYKVAFNVNENNVTSYFNYTKNKVADYNTVNNNTLPVPATYIIGQDNKITFVHYDPDYSKRFDITELFSM